MFIEGIQKTPSVDFLIYDRTNFPRPRIRRILPPLIADLIRETHTHGPVPFLTDGNARPDVIPYPLPALTLGDRSKDVRAALEPVIKAMRDLDVRAESMVDGTIFHREMMQREISRVLVLNLSGKASGAPSLPRTSLTLTAPSLLSRGTR